MSLVLLSDSSSASSSSSSSLSPPSSRSSESMSVHMEQYLSYIPKLDSNKIWRRLVQIYSMRGEINATRICIKGLKDSSRRQVQILSSLCGFIWRETKEKNMWLMVPGQGQTLKTIPSANEPCWESFGKVDMVSEVDISTLKLDQLENEVKECIKAYIDMWLRDISKTFRRRGASCTSLETGCFLMDEEWVQNEVLNLGKWLGLSASNMGNGHMKVQNIEKKLNINTLLVDKPFEKDEPDFVSYLESCYESLPLGKTRLTFRIDIQCPEVRREIVDIVRAIGFATAKFTCKGKLVLSRQNEFSPASLRSGLRNKKLNQKEIVHFKDLDTYVKRRIRATLLTWFSNFEKQNFISQNLFTNVFLMPELWVKTEAKQIAAGLELETYEGHAELIVKRKSAQLQNKRPQAATNTLNSGRTVSPDEVLVWSQLKALYREALDMHIIWVSNLDLECKRIICQISTYIGFNCVEEVGGYITLKKSTMTLKDRLRALGCDRIPDDNISNHLGAKLNMLPISLQRNVMAIDKMVIQKIEHFLTEKLQYFYLSNEQEIAVSTGCYPLPPFTISRICAKAATDLNLGIERRSSLKVLSIVKGQPENFIPATNTANSSIENISIRGEMGYEGEYQQNLNNFFGCYSAQEQRQSSFSIGFDHFQNFNDTTTTQSDRNITNFANELNNIYMRSKIEEIPSLWLAPQQNLSILRQNERLDEREEVNTRADLSVSKIQNLLSEHENKKNNYNSSIFTDLSLFDGSLNSSIPLFGYIGAVVYARTEVESDMWCDIIKACKINSIGFDTEWKPDFILNENNPTALIQICFRKYPRNITGHKNREIVETSDSQAYMCVLFHVFYYGVPLKLARILDDPEIIKVGVEIDVDIKKLDGHYGTAVIPALELHDEAALKRNVTVRGLRSLVYSVLGQDFPKDKSITLSNWEAVLDETQKIYAAYDAYAALKIYEALSLP